VTGHPAGEAAVTGHPAGNDVRSAIRSRDQLADRCRAYVAREHAPPVVTTQWIDALGVGWRANATPPPGSLT